MALNVSRQCWSWLHEFIADDNATTLEMLNNAFRKRNMGGIIFVSILIVFGCIGNLHVLVIYSQKFKHSNYKTFVIFLACLDMINCSITMPFVIFYLMHPLNYPSDLLCKCFRGVMGFISLASSFVLLLIGLHRYRKICTPRKRQFSMFQTKVACGIVLVLSLLFTWPNPILYGKSSVDTGIANITGIRCFTLDRYKGTFFQRANNAALTLIFLSISFILPVMYHRIMRDVKKHVTFSAACNSPIGADASFSSGRSIQGHRTTTTFFFVTIGYVASALPFHVLAMLIFFIKDFDCVMSFEAGTVYYTFIWIFFLNNVLNPIIYGFSDKKFQNEAVNLYSKFKKIPTNKPSRELQVFSSKDSRDSETADGLARPDKNYKTTKF